MPWPKASFRLSMVMEIVANMFERQRDLLEGRLSAAPDPV